MSTSHDSNERRQAIWPWILMPIVVLLVAYMLHGFEDYAEVPPIDEDGVEAQTARELLHWALAGAVPERYREYAQLGQLLAMNDIDLLTAIAQDLRLGMHGHDLANFGGVLLALADR